MVEQKTLVYLLVSLQRDRDAVTLCRHTVLSEDALLLGARSDLLCKGFRSPKAAAVESQIADARQNAWNLEPELSLKD